MYDALSLAPADAATRLGVVGYRVLESGCCCSHIISPHEPRTQRVEKGPEINNAVCRDGGKLNNLGPDNHPNRRDYIRITPGYTVSMGFKETELTYLPKIVSR